MYNIVGSECTWPHALPARKGSGGSKLPNATKISWLRSSEAVERVFSWISARLSFEFCFGLGNPPLETFTIFQQTFVAFKEGGEEVAKEARPKKARICKSKTKTMLTAFFEWRGLSPTRLSRLDRQWMLKWKIVHKQSEIKDSCKLHPDNAPSYTAFILNDYPAWVNITPTSLPSRLAPYWPFLIFPLEISPERKSLPFPMRRASVLSWLSWIFQRSAYWTTPFSRRLRANLSNMPFASKVLSSVNLSMLNSIVEMGDPWGMPPFAFLGVDQSRRWRFWLEAKIVKFLHAIRGSSVSITSIITTMLPHCGVSLLYIQEGHWSNVSLKSCCFRILYQMFCFLYYGRFLSETELICW